MILSFSEYFHEQWLGGLHKTYTNLYQPPLFHKTSYTSHLYCLSVFPLLDQLLYVVHDTKSLYKWWLLHQIVLMASETKSDHA